MSIFDPEFTKLRFRMPAYRCTLGDAARLERDVLLILREIFPDAREWIATGQPRKPVAVNLDSETAFTDMIVRLRRTGPRGQYQDPASQFYDATSVPHLFTTDNGFFTPHPRKDLKPHPDASISWSASFDLGSPEGMYDTIFICFPYAVAQSLEGAAKVEMLMERLVKRIEPETARFAVIHFDKAFWKVDQRIGWLTYLSQPTLVEHLQAFPRTRPFHHGLILKLSDDPRDMLNDEFVQQSFEFCQTLVPYWPPKRSEQS